MENLFEYDIESLMKSCEKVEYKTNTVIYK